MADIKKQIEDALIQVSADNEMARSAAYMIANILFVEEKSPDLDLSIATVRWLWPLLASERNWTLAKLKESLLALSSVSPSIKKEIEPLTNRICLL